MYRSAQPYISLKYQRNGMLKSFQRGKHWIRCLSGAAWFSRAREWCLVLATSLALALGWKSRAWEGWWPWPCPAPTSLAVRKVFP